MGKTELLNNALTFLNKSGKPAAWVVWASTLILIILPDTGLQGIGLGSFMAEYGTVARIVLLGSSLLIFGMSVAWVFSSERKWRSRRIAASRLRELIASCGSRELSYLAVFMNETESVLYFQMRHPSIEVLKSKSLLIPLITTHSGLRAFELPAEIREVLDRWPDLLQSADPNSCAYQTQDEIEGKGDYVPASMLRR